LQVNIKNLIDDTQKSCSSIGKNQVPQPSTDTNDIVLKMLYAIAKGMDQKLGALHATNGMLAKDAYATHSGIGSLVLIAQWRVGVLVTLARLRRWDVNLRTTVSRLTAEIA
jgi:hypothetical protein